MTLDALLSARSGRTAGAPHFTAHVDAGFEAAYDIWETMAAEGAALPFQRRAWLAPWAETKGRDGNVEMLAVTLRDGAGAPVAGLPLVRERRGRLTRIGFADGGLADYNGPVLSARAPQDKSGAQGLWRALRAALPRSDVLRFERMPQRIGSRVNPFALLDAATPVASGGLSLDIPGAYADWLREKPRRYRMELGRCARLFDATPDARFERVTGDIDPVFSALESLQSRRIGMLGHRYVLDEDNEARFYRRIVADSGRNGVLTALRIGDAVVAAMFGLRDGDWFIMLRIGASQDWSNLSPARLLIVRTIEHLRAEGVRTFDFGLGDYPYKRKLGAQPMALYDLVAARSPLGLAEVGHFRLAAAMRGNPRLFATVKNMRDKARGILGKP